VQGVAISTTLGNSTTLELDFGGTAINTIVGSGGGLFGQGTLAGALLDNGVVSFDAAGNTSFSLSGSGTFEIGGGEAVVNAAGFTGSVTVAFATLQLVGGALAGSRPIAIGQNGTLELAGPGVAGSRPISLVDTGAVLRIDGTSMPTNTISNFSASDVIDLADVAFVAGASATLNGSNNLAIVMVRGFDVSVGAVISLTVVIGSFLMTEDMNAGLILLGSLVCLAAGIIVGLTNGTLVRYVGINSVVTTIAMLSVVQGIALYLRPSPFGVISEDFIDFFQTRIGFMPVSFFVILAAAIGGDIWLYRTRSGLKMRAVGFREEAAKRNGVRIDIVHIRAFLLSAVIAVLSGLLVGSEVGVGTPVIGSSYT
jgi:ribose/xylose/arabinose/galactoside ABC-type transport system permease subunit